MLDLGFRLNGSGARAEALYKQRLTSKLSAFAKGYAEAQWDGSGAEFGAIGGLRLRF